MNEINKVEALTKAGLITTGALLVTVGISRIESGDTQTGLILVAIGVTCIFIREILKPYFDERR